MVPNPGEPKIHILDVSQLIQFISSLVKTPKTSNICQIRESAGGSPGPGLGNTVLDGQLLAELNTYVPANQDRQDY